MSSVAVTKTPATKLRYFKVLRIAVAAEANPKSVRNVLDGRRVRGPVDERIRKQLTAANIAFPSVDDEGDDE